MKVKLSRLLELADGLSGADADPSTIEMIETRAGHYEPRPRREPPSTAVRRVVERFADAQKRVRVRSRLW